MSQDSAFEKAVELVLHELRQVGAAGLLHMGEEVFDLFLHHAVQGSLLGAATFVVNRGSIRSPLELSSGGRHALLAFGPRDFMVRRSKALLNRRE